jgi:hypothetical protein
MRIVLLHHPHTQGSLDWIQYIASTVSNVHIVEAKDFSEAMALYCRSRSFSLILTTEEKVKAEVPGRENATGHCLLYERWSSIAKDLFHKRMTWNPYDMLRWISFMKTNFAPCSASDKHLRVDIMYRKHWEHMVKLFPNARVKKRIEAWLRAWHLDPKDPTWNEVVVGLRPDKVSHLTRVLPINSPASNRRMERLLGA